GDGRTDTDSDGHGTGMASVIAGNGAHVSGLAPSAKILPVRIDASGKGTMFASNVAAGIRYATQAHVGVINLSVGGNVDFGSDVQQAISQAVAANIVVVAAAGNESASSVDFPAAYPGVVAVGAVDQSGQAWSQSNTGQVALAAPGVQIYRDNNFGQQGTSSGTSEATAYVSATAALIRSAHPDWTAGQVIRDLISTADPGSGQTAGQHSDQYGYGIIDPLKALQASAPSDTSNPLLGASGASATPNSGSGSGSVGNASSSPTAAASSASSSHTGLIIGVVVGVIIVLGLVLLVVALARRGRGGPKPPSGPGQYGGGYQPPNPQQNPYQQQGPYQQQNPYQQSPYQQQPPQYPQNPNQ
ncbi:MAG TPA: S8 family serine peptidase, partial [Mycobacterium sp.]|nr:S8 family serine peptidase [Mycobacterium sp.]